MHLCTLYFEVFRIMLILLSFILVITYCAAMPVISPVQLISLDKLIMTRIRQPAFVRTVMGLSASRCGINPACLPAPCREPETRRMSPNPAGSWLHPDLSELAPRNPLLPVPIKPASRWPNAPNEPPDDFVCLFLTHLRFGRTCSFGGSPMRLSSER